EAPVRDPVREEQDVPRLLLHHAVEAGDERGREDSGVGGEAEEAEGEERIEALPVPHPEEAPLWVARPLRAAVGDRDPVVGEQALEQRRMPALLVGLERDRLAQHRIGLGVRHRLDARPGGALAADRLFPEGQRAETLEVGVVEQGPADVANLVRLEGPHELMTEERLVLGTAEVQCWHAYSPPGPRRYTGRTGREQGSHRLCRQANPN